MLRNFIYLSLTALFSTVVFGQNNAYIKFQIKNAGVTVDGSFSDFDATVHIDPNDLSNAKFNGSIQVKSIDTGIKKRDKDLLSSSYFDVEKHPKITFSVSSVKAAGNGKYTVIGDLTIKGVKKRVNFDVIKVRVADKLYFKGEIELNRRDFNVGGSSWVLADELKAMVRLRIND